MMMFSILLAAVLEFTPADAHVAYETARTLVEKCTPRDAGSIRGRCAANSLLDMASEYGADVRCDRFRATTPKGERELTNLYATFTTSGTNKNWVVLVSHFDTKTGVKCPGANDGASTSGLLVGLANAFSRIPNMPCNVMLVWTDGEESMVSYGENDGFWGSRRAVEHVRSRGLRVSAVICLDMLGDKDLHIGIPSNGDAALAKKAVAAAKDAGYPGLVTVSENLVKDDHVAFLKAGYKAIDLIDFSYGPDNAFWHTEEDTMANISEESLLKSGKIVVNLVEKCL